MKMKTTKQRMKTNFDTLEAAGLVQSASDNPSLMKARAEQRIQELETLGKKIQKIEAAVGELYTTPQEKQIKKLSVIVEAAKKLHASPLPQGSKASMTMCINELVSLREGMFLGAPVDKKTLSLIACQKARETLNNMTTNTKARMERLVADSSSESDLDQFYKMTEDVINKHLGERAKVSDIESKPFVVTRVPVVPAGSPVSVEKLTNLGFKVDSLGGYAVLQNQLVIGINLGKIIPKASEMKAETVKKLTREEALMIKKRLEKMMGTKLQFVAERAFSYKSGTWFWLMSNHDLDLLARAFAGSHVKVDRWGFAFN